MELKRYALKGIVHRFLLFTHLIFNFFEVYQMIPRIILTILLLLCGLVSSSFASDNAAAIAAIKAGAQVVDVRTTGEFAAGHLITAQNIDYETISDHLAELNPDKTKLIVLYCGSGFRAEKARKALLAKGYSAVLNAGGYDELVEAGLLSSK